MIDSRNSFYCNNLDLLPPKPKFTFRHLKKGVQEFHRRFVLASADKAANNMCVRLKRYYIHTLKQELSTAKTYEQYRLDATSIVDRHRCHMAAKIVSEYDQEIPQSQTADNPVAPRGKAAQPSQDTRKTNQAKQPAVSSPSS